MTLEVNAPAAGVLAEIVGADRRDGRDRRAARLARARRARRRASRAAPAARRGARSPPQPPRPRAGPAMPPAPAAAKLAAENGIDLAAVAGSGKRGQVLKGDVIDALAKPARRPRCAAPRRPRRPPRRRRRMRAPSPPDDASREERVRLTKLRQTIARRLKDAQNTAAMLTTFNEVDMSEVMALRANYKDAFEKKHGVKLGFMGFFVKACVQALKEIPAVNAEIDGADLVFKNYYHLGIAVGTDKGLVVPVVRDADRSRSPRSRSRSPISASARATAS